MSDITVAISSKTIKKLFETIVNSFNYAPNPQDTQVTSGALKGTGVTLKLKLKIRNDTKIELHNDNTIHIRELDVLFDTLILKLRIDIPSICVGGGCAIPDLLGDDPWGQDCLVHFPQVCIFESNPDISLTLDLSHLISSEVSIRAKPVIKPQSNNVNNPQKWQLFIDPVTVDLDPLDVSDMVGDLLERALNTLLSGLPQDVRDAIEAITGPLIDYLRAYLDIPDDIDEWLSDIVGQSIGTFNIIVTVVADFFARQKPLLEIEDPLKLGFLDNISMPPLRPASELDTVKIPIRNPNAQVNASELILTVDVGV